jgi:enabled protein
MCHYIFNTKECGHRVKDHVEPHNCPHFQRTQVHCDRDNGDHRNRWTYEDKEVYGICNNCLRDARKTEEAAMEREREQMRAQDLREAKEKEDQLRRGEEELREKNRRENGEAKEQKRRAEKQEEEERQKERQRKLATAKAREEARTKEMERIRLEAEAKDQEDTEKAMRQSLEEHEARLAADMKEAERLSKADVDRQAKLKEDEDFKFMIEKSLAEDEARRQKEVDDTARALRDSALFNAPARNYQDDVVSLSIISLFSSILGNCNANSIITVRPDAESNMAPHRKPHHHQSPTIPISTGTSTETPHTTSNTTCPSTQTQANNIPPSSPTQTHTKTSRIILRQSSRRLPGLRPLQNREPVRTCPRVTKNARDTHKPAIADRLSPNCTAGWRYCCG